MWHVYICQQNQMLIKWKEKALCLLFFFFFIFSVAFPFIEISHRKCHQNHICKITPLKCPSWRKCWSSENGAKMLTIWNKFFFAKPHNSIVFLLHALELAKQLFYIQSGYLKNYSTELKKKQIFFGGRRGGYLYS